MSPGHMKSGHTGSGQGPLSPSFLAPTASQPSTRNRAHVEWSSPRQTLPVTHSPRSSLIAPFMHLSGLFLACLWRQVWLVSHTPHENISICLLYTCCWL